jgi:hypothetical protein
MDTRTDDGLDGRLREALEPPPEAVGRIVRAALAAERPAARSSRLVPAVAGAAALLALAALYLARPQARARVSIENVGEVLVVQRQEGGRVLIHNGSAAGSSSPSGSMIVIHGGMQ